MSPAELVRLVDRLEETSGGYLTLEQVETAARESVQSSIDDGLMVVDYRTRADGTPVTLCRLNRHHPLVSQLTGW